MTAPDKQPERKPWSQLTPTEAYHRQRSNEKRRVGRYAEARAHALKLVVSAVPRDPCVWCGVPAHRHEEHGCSRYIPQPH